MNNQSTGANERRGWPLCRSYFLVLFESVSVALQAASQSDGPVWDQVFEN